MPNLKALLKLADDVAEKSPDPYKKVGCIALDSMGNYVCAGHNHAGLKTKLDNLFWQDREGRAKFMIHAELDMLAKAALTPDKKVSTVVLTLFPCTHCMTALAIFGVKVIHYREIYDKDKPAIEVASHYGIECHQFDEDNDGDKPSLI